MLFQKDLGKSLDKNFSALWTYELSDGRYTPKLKKQGLSDGTYMLRHTKIFVKQDTYITGS